jgi:D-alanyl-D-alanine carboxypeptidase
VILGRIVETFTRRPIEEVVRDRIFAPLNLGDSTYGSASVGEASADTSWLGAHLSATVEPETGAGGIESTADDVGAFFQALLGGKLLDEPEMAEMLTTVPTGSDPLAGVVAGDPKAGLGIFGFTLPCGAAWGHGGDMFQYSNQVLVSGDGSTVVVVARNMGGWPHANAVAEDLFCAVQGQ